MTRRLGICFKCGKETLVQDHHWKGYSEEHKDDVKPYCRACDREDHRIGMLNGKFPFDYEESARLSTTSSIRRKRKADPLTYNGYQKRFRNYPSQVAGRKRYMRKTIMCIGFDQGFNGARCRVRLYINTNTWNTCTTTGFDLSRKTNARNYTRNKKEIQKENYKSCPFGVENAASEAAAFEDKTRWRKPAFNRLSNRGRRMRHVTK